MKVLNVGLSSFLTGTEIAVAVMAYSRALCSCEQVDLVTIPFLSEYARKEDAQFVVGWGASLSSVSVRFDGNELIDEAIVDQLRGRSTQQIRERSPQPRAIRIEASDLSDIQSFDFDEL